MLTNHYWLLVWARVWGRSLLRPSPRHPLTFFFIFFILKQILRLSSFNELILNLLVHTLTIIICFTFCLKLFKLAINLKLVKSINSLECIVTPGFSNFHKISSFIFAESKHCIYIAILGSVFVFLNNKSILLADLLDCLTLIMMIAILIIFEIFIYLLKCSS